MRLQAIGKSVVFAALVALIGIGGCQSGDTGGGEAPGGGRGTSGATARASAVTVTYYYLPG